MSDRQSAARMAVPGWWRQWHVSARAGGRSSRSRRRVRHLMKPPDERVWFRRGPYKGVGQPFATQRLVGWCALARMAPQAPRDCQTALTGWRFCDDSAQNRAFADLAGIWQTRLGQVSDRHPAVWQSGASHQRPANAPTRHCPSSGGLQTRKVARDELNDCSYPLVPIGPGGLPCPHGTQARLSRGNHRPEDS